MGMSPFELVYGQQPMTPHEITVQKIGGKCPMAYRFARTKQEMWDEAKDSLAKAQRRMKKYADKGRRPVEFSVGDQVLLKLTPQIWKKISAKVVNRGLVPKYDGPFEVLSKAQRAPPVIRAEFQKNEGEELTADEDVGFFWWRKFVAPFGQMSRTGSADCGQHVQAGRRSSRVRPRVVEWCMTMPGAGKLAAHAGRTLCGSLRTAAETLRTWAGCCAADRVLRAGRRTRTRTRQTWRAGRCARTRQAGRQIGERAGERQICARLAMLAGSLDRTFIRSGCKTITGFLGGSCPRVDKLIGCYNATIQLSQQPP
ncbi:hypothetical protein Salat_1704200 [Sesamum alatum]|uniref:Uncharacterized protein n=1 Tax=Sesamum alatum TaxID=300844 RepID=A0AAE2CKB1_9LAMI|nr:hypothetical protein Salat_1704200 [Sesamum alatum]